MFMLCMVDLAPIHFAENGIKCHILPLDAILIPIMVAGASLGAAPDN
jgi:hypothetical protein